MKYHETLNKFVFYLLCSVFEGDVEVGIFLHIFLASGRIFSPYALF